jgi:serine protease Do
MNVPFISIPFKGFSLRDIGLPGFIAVLMTALIPGNAAFAVDAFDDPVVQIIQAARPSTVNIEARSPISARLGPLGDIIASRQGTNKQAVRWYKSVASGVIWDAEGHVITTASVVKDAVEFSVKTNSSKLYVAHLIGVDPESNLAVLKCHLDPGESLPSLPKRSAELPEGSWIVLLGYGFGGMPTVAPGMAGVPPQQYDPARMWFQFTAPIRPGNSGSAIIDSRGNLAGIVLGKEDDTGFQAVLKKLTQPVSPRTSLSSSQSASRFAASGVAIATDRASDIITQLITKGEVVRGWLGVGVKGTKCRVSGQTICLEIIRLIENSPADIAGLKIGDCLLKYENHLLRTPSELGHLVSSTAPGTSVWISYERENEVFQTPVDIVIRPPRKNQVQQLQKDTVLHDPESLGVTLQNLSPSLRKHFNVSESEGIIVSEIRKDSPFDSTSINVGDIITGLDGYPVKSMEDFCRILAGKSSAAQVRITVYRNGSSMEIPVTLP